MLTGMALKSENRALGSHIPNDDRRAIAFAVNCPKLPRCQHAAGCRDREGIDLHVVAPKELLEMWVAQIRHYHCRAHALDVHGRQKRMRQQCARPCTSESKDVLQFQRKIVIFLFSP